MILRKAAAFAALSLLSGAAFAQITPEDEASRPPPKPEQSQPAEPASPPPERPDVDQGTDSGPEAKAEAAETAPVTGTPEEASKPGSIGRLIPPEQAEQATKLEQPKGPPIRQTLRESKFDFSACLLALHDLGTEYEILRTIRDDEQRDCGIARPIRVTEIVPGVTLEGGAEMRCDTARALGFWVNEFVRPATSRLPDAPRLSGMQLGTTYDCRGRVGTGEAPKLSEHAFGNAIDIAAFTFHNAEPIPVTPRQDSGDLIESFQRAVRGAACLYFTTVLGPGSNAAHDDHLHLDIAARNGGWRLCQ